MVTVVSTAINPKTASQQGPAGNGPKPSQVTSRYMSSSSSSTSRRCHSPLLSSKMNSSAMVTPTLTKRSLSVERSRPANPRPKSSYLGVGNGGGTGTPASQKTLFTSTRSLSVSFQGESFSIQVSKEKPAPSQNFRKITPERRKTTTPARGASGNSGQTENSRPIDQQRWPGRMQRKNCMSTSVDCADDRTNFGGSRDIVTSLQNLMVDVQASFDETMSSETGKGEIKKVAEVIPERNKVSGSQLKPPELIPSDNESVSSGSSSGAQDYSVGGEEQGQRGPRGIVMPVRLWQEANNRLRRQTEPASPSSRNTGNKAIASPKNLNPKKSVFDSPITSPQGIRNNRGQGSPLRAAVRPASPSKLATPSTASPLRGVSPSRVRNAIIGSLNNSLSNVPSILSFAVDVRRRKIGENRIVDDAHLLKLLYNKLLQWRFVNARTDAALSAQRLNAETSLHNAWVATSKLRESVRAKRTEFKLLKQHFKLISILKDQIIYLEDWALLDRGYSSSLSGAIEALKASTLRLPVVGRAKADVLNVKDAIYSAMDVMRVMASSIHLLLPKVGHVNSLVFEVANLSGKERVLLDECIKLLSIIATLQVSERSLRTHIIQLKCQATKVTS